MIIKIDDYDITELLLSYSRSMNMTSLIGNAAVSSLSISYDNEECQFGYARLKSAIFEVQPTNNSKKYFFKAYEMPETYDGIVELTLYDSLYEFDSLYQSTLSYPTTVKKQLDEMGVLTGIEIDYTQLDSSIVNKTVNENDNTLSMRDYLRWIAEIGGCNVFSSSEKYEEITFKRMASTVSVTCRDAFDYKKGNPYTISGIEFDNSQLSFSIGNQTSNVYIVANDNPYVTSINDLKAIEEVLLGMTLDSATDVEIDYIDNLSLGDIIECPNTFKFMILDFIEEYVGGEYPDLKLSGELSTENSESVGNSVSNDVKIRLLKLQAKEIEAETLKVSRQIITLNLEVEGKANISDLNALKATIDNLDVDNLDVKYAKIDMSNVGIENVGKLFADIGLLKDVNIVNGSVTGVLNGVRINGDLIVANTLKVKDLLLEGADGLIYQINALASGLSLSELTDEIYQRKLNGTDIVANSITGTQIAGKTITAREIDVFDLFAQNITATGTITGLAFKGGSININDVFTVNSAGYVKASSGRIGNFNLTQNYISSSFKTEYGVEWSNEVLKLDSGKIHFDYNNNFYRNTSATDLVKYLEINGDEILFHCSKEDGVSKSTTAQIILQSDSSNLDSHLLITCSRGRILTDCNFISNKNIITGIDKISSVDGVAGVALSQNGNIYLTSDTSPSLFFYNGNSTSYTHLIQAQSDQFYVSRTTTINGSVHIKNNSALWSKNTSGSNKQLIGISSSNNLFIGSSEGSECTGDTNIYAGEHISLYANRISSSYKATALELLREQTDNHRTILRPASNSGIYLGTTNYRFNTAFFANSITASDLKEKEVVHDFDFKVEEFIKGMKPIAYRRKGKEDTGERIHIGFGAQTTNQLIKQLGLGDLSMVQASIINADGSESSYHGENVDDNKLSWGLNYTEMIPYAFLGIQDLYMKYNQLEQENKMLRSQLEAFISELSTREVLI